LTGSLALQDEEQGESLNRLAKPHVVSQWTCPHFLDKQLSLKLNFLIFFLHEWRIESWDCLVGSSQKEFKLAAVRRLEQGASIGEAARALEVNPNVLHRWRREFRQGPGNVLPGNGKQRWLEGRIAELERKVGQPGDRFVEGMLAAHRGTPDAAGTDWKAAVCRRIQEEVKANRGLTVERMVKLGQISRSSFYRFDGGSAGSTGWRYGTPRRHPPHRPGVAQLRTAPHYGRAAPARLDGESQAGSGSAPRR
jgi:hypothetical protein